MHRVAFPAYFVCKREEPMDWYHVPLFISYISAGFPPPADDYKEVELDVNELVIRHPEATFYVRVSGDSMEQAAICDGDVLVVDRAVEARHNDVIVALVNGEFAIKRLHTHGDALYLVPENPLYQPLEITEAMDFRVWGVVTYCIHRVR
jgi:DNA polymerase V